MVSSSRLRELAGLAVVHRVEPPPLVVARGALSAHVESRRLRSFRHAVAVRVRDELEQVELRDVALDRLEQRGRESVDDLLHVAEQLLQLRQRRRRGDHRVRRLVEGGQRVEDGLRDDVEQPALEFLDEVVDVEVQRHEVMHGRVDVLRVEEQEVRSLAPEEEVRQPARVGEQRLHLRVLGGCQGSAEAAVAKYVGAEPIGDQVVDCGPGHSSPRGSAQGDRLYVSVRARVNTVPRTLEEENSICSRVHLRRDPLAQ